jgi:1-phosphofructokinase family hexose kinase
MKSGSFLCVCLNPTIQNTLVFRSLAKGEVNRTANHRVDASGKGVNVARVLKQTGREATYLAQLGGPTRDWFLSMCEADGLNVAWAESGQAIRVCTTVVDEADGSATELVEEALSVAEGTTERVLEVYAKELPSATAVIVSGTKAAGFSPDAIPSMVGSATSAGKKVVLDIKGADLAASLSFRPLVAKPNLEELLQTYAPAKAQALRAGELDDDGALRDLVAGVGAEYWSRFGTYLVVTRGAKSTLYWDGAALREHQGRVVKALNPIGSGDSFTAGLTAVLVEGGDLAEAVAEGSRLGAINAEKLMPGSIR